MASARDATPRADSRDGEAVFVRVGRDPSGVCDATAKIIIIIIIIIIYELLSSIQ